MIYVPRRLRVWLGYTDGPLTETLALDDEQFRAAFVRSDYSAARIQPELLRPVPSWWRWVPFLHVTMASALAPVSPFVYLPKDMWQRFQAHALTHKDQAVIIHEQVHIARYKNVSWVRAARYVWSRKERLTEELLGISAEMAYLQRQGLPYDIERKARQFSSRPYFWLGSEEESRAVLRRLWDMVRSGPK